MELSRRDLLKASSRIAAALGLGATGLFRLDEAFGLEADQGGLQVVWLQGQSCSGCSVSLINSTYYNTIDDLLLNTLDVNFHSTLMAPAHSLAIAAAEEAYSRGNYVLVIEGAIPAKSNGAYCTLWEGMTMLRAVKRYAFRASHILAVGTCACYGGMAGGAPNPTGAHGVGMRLAGKSVINLPGCPTHPDWVVGTIAYLIANGQPPTLDSYGRPTSYFSTTVHQRCPMRGTPQAQALSQQGCLQNLGCKGRNTKADCPVRKWNAGAAGQYGANWCVGAGAPCYGCVEPSFPDGMSPFYTVS